MPLSSIVKQTPDDVDSSEDDVPLSSIAKKAPPKKSADDDSSSSDDEDDVPLSEMKEKLSKKRKLDLSKKQKKSSSNSNKRAKRTSSPSKKVKSTGPRKIPTQFQWSRVMALPVIAKEDLLKPQLVNHVLRRWKYCGIEWPPKGMKDKKPSSKNFLPLAGFPGVFVGVKGSVLGEIEDYRPMEGRPCFSQFILRPSKELRDLWRTGVEAQMKDLISHEGDSAPTLQLLRQELVICNKISDSKLLSADKVWDKKGKNWLK